MTNAQRRLMIVAMCSTGALAATARAQWTVTLLRPAGGGYAEGLGAGPGHQTGSVRLAGVTTAFQWNGGPASFTNLAPAGAVFSSAEDTDGAQQVGVAQIGISGTMHASLWTGTAASWVDLNPVGISASKAYGVHAGHQVGYINIPGGMEHASLWPGTAASMVDLAPANSLRSEARGVHAGTQVGFAEFQQGVFTQFHAGMWSGSSASWIDLSPGDTQSACLDTDGAQQVGSAFGQAGFWTGTAGSWTNLHPSGPGILATSYAAGVFDGFQVGVVDFFGVQAGHHASLWNGSAASWEDLHDALVASGGSWGDSVALDVWHDATTLYIVGHATSNDAGREEAILWSRPIPAPGAAWLIVGAGALAVRRWR